MRSLRRDEEYVWRAFKDDPVLKMVMAAPINQFTPFFVKGHRKCQGPENQ